MEAVGVGALVGNLLEDLEVSFRGRVFRGADRGRGGQEQTITLHHVDHTVGETSP